MLTSPVGLFGKYCLESCLSTHRADNTLRQVFKDFLEKLCQFSDSSSIKVEKQTMRFKNRCARHAKHSHKPFNYAEDGRLLTGGRYSQ